MRNERMNNAALLRVSRGRTTRARVRRPRAGHCAVAVLVGLVLVLHTPVSARQEITRAAAAHFLEQGTFGPTAADVDLVISQGYEQWLNNQFAMPESPMPDDPEVDDVRNQLFMNMASGQDQLRQRVVFALSQIIVVSAAKNSSGLELAPWVRLLSRNAFGNFRTLIHEVSLSPTMTKYLDNAFNRCMRSTVTCPNGSTTSVPNENYARELLQLFTLGLWELNLNGTVRLNAAGQPIPTYNQATVVEYARALTGWTYARTNDADNYRLPVVPSMTSNTNAPEPRSHDIGSKTLLSGVVLPARANTTAGLYADVDGVINSIMVHPNLAPFVSMRLIRSLVTSNPSPNYVRRVATVFRDTGGDLRATITAILSDPESRTFTITDGRLKDPILHVLGLARALGIPVANPDDAQWQFHSLLQLVLTPTTVFNFYNLLTPLPSNTAMVAPEFGIYPPALAVQRANFIHGILWDRQSSAFPMSGVLPAYQRVARDPAALAEAVNQHLMFGRMTPDLRGLIVAATAAITDPSEYGLRERARGALYLAAVSSEYSVYSDASVAGAASVQPPTGLAVSGLDGSTVTLTWRAPLIGPAPTGYVLEGGVRPGEVLASIPIAGSAPTFTFQAPPGAFYIRLRTVSGANTSRPSGEIRLYVGASSGPTAPRSLTAYGNGSSVVLNWRNTFGGGEPAGIVVDVTQDGARVASIPMPLTSTWSYDFVPAGTFGFTVRATNASGTSGSSNSVTLTFPLPGCSVPLAPESVSVAATGRTVSVHWLAPSSGTTPSRYVVEARRRNSNGSTTALGTFPVTTTTISGSVGPATYEVRVKAENICGSSSNSGWQSVTVQ
jgi:uncharacterized protein (DUF1800 family)